MIFAALLLLLQSAPTSLSAAVDIHDSPPACPGCLPCPPGQQYYQAYPTLSNIFICFSRPCLPDQYMVEVWITPGLRADAPACVTR